MNFAALISNEIKLTEVSLAIYFTIIESMVVLLQKISVG
jgi:hypothetical protein